MNYQLTWTAVAEEQLAALWLGSADRNRLSATRAVSESVWRPFVGPAVPDSSSEQRVRHSRTYEGPP